MTGADGHKNAWLSNMVSLSNDVRQVFGQAHRRLFSQASGLRPQAFRVWRQFELKPNC